MVHAVNGPLGKFILTGGLSEQVARASRKGHSDYRSAFFVMMPSEVNCKKVYSFEVQVVAPVRAGKILHTRCTVLLPSGKKRIYTPVCVGDVVYTKIMSGFSEENLLNNKNITPLGEDTELKDITSHKIIPQVTVEVGWFDALNQVLGPSVKKQYEVVLGYGTSIFFCKIGRAHV